ncbi:hypothetical protein N7G274_008158 [Stereocaulon virgatum]|uniref:Uncharacterized protein n=1 Tax=Stereocaulon virgatum TaxID=373712 RepID=A0ABR4A2X5_9LECA
MLYGLLIIFSATLVGSAVIENNTQNITSSFTTTGQYDNPLRSECLKPSSPFDIRPRFVDCGRIIEDLPQSEKLADFHIQGGHDDYKLPWEKTLETCQIRVEINKFWVTDVGSWMGIKLVTLDLVTHCRSYTKDPRTGGSAVTGNGGRIMITVRKNPYYSIDKNATASILDPSSNDIQTE